MLDEAGASGSDLLAEYGLDEETIAAGDSFLSIRSVARVLEDAARRFGLPDLGLRMAAQQDLRILGPLAIAMENARTIGDAVEYASRYLFGYSPAVALDAEDDPWGDATVVGLYYSSGTNESPQAVDYGIGFVHRVMTLVNGGAPYGLRAVLLPHPRLASERAYRGFFQAEVRFDCPSAVLRIPTRLLARPVLGSNELLRGLAVDYMERHFGHRKVAVSELVARIVGEQLASDGPDLSQVARLLSRDKRSVQRLLAAEGVTFQAIVDRVRKDQALALITNTDLSLAQVAARLGMREQSSLTRSVHRWFGMSPSRLRRSPPKD